MIFIIQFPSYKQSKSTDFNYIPAEKCHINAYRPTEDNFVGFLKKVSTIKCQQFCDDFITKIFPYQKSFQLIEHLLHFFNEISL